MTISEFVNKVGFKVKKEDVQKVNDTMKDIKKTATNLLGAIGIGFSLKAINGLIEEFGNVNNSIQNAIGNLGDLEGAEDLVLQKANEARASYKDMASTVTSLTQASSALFPLEDAANFSGTVTKLLKSAGRSDNEINSVMSDLTKSFQKGVVDASTVNNLLTKAPEAANVLAKSLGVSKEHLATMASSGLIKVNDLKAAFLNAAGEIDAAFEKTDMTISDALKNIRNKWGLWLAQTDKTLGVTKSIAKMMVSGFNQILAVLNKVRTGFIWLSEKVGGTENLFKLLAITAGSIFVALNAQKILNFLKQVGSILGIGKAKTMALIAVIVMIALVIEDLFNFVKGNNSLIGELLQKAGLDADEFRETLKGLWEQVKGLVPVFVNLGKTIGQLLLSAFTKLVPIIMKMVISLLPVLVNLITKVVEFIVEIAGALLPLLIDFLVELIDAVLPVIVDLISSIIPLCIQIIEAILPVIIQLVQAILPLLMKIIQAVLPVIINLINTILPLLVEIITAILPVIIDLINAVLPLLAEIIEAILPIIIDLINTILPLLAEIIEAVLPVIIELVRTIIPPLIQIIEAVLPVIIELINTIIPILMKIIEAVLPVIIQLVQAILPLLTTIIEAVLPVIISLIDALLPVLEPIFEIVETLVDAFLPIIVQLLSLIGPILEPIAAILKPIGDILGVIIGAIGKVVGWIASGLGWIVDLIFGGGGDASDNASKVAGYAKGTDNSDETFIAGEEGPELITGSRGKKVFTALETGNILNAMSVLSRSATAKPSTITNSSNSRVVNQYNEFVNTFNGEKALQKSASKTMNGNAEDATALLARGLAFAK